MKGDKKMKIVGNEVFFTKEEEERIDRLLVESDEEQRKNGDKLYSHDEVWRLQEMKTIKNYIGLNKKEKNYAVNFRRQKNN